MGGEPCIRGMRVTVSTVVGLVAAGRTREEILREYPYVEAEDIAAFPALPDEQRKSKIRCASREPGRGHEPIARLGRRGWQRHGFGAVHWSTIVL
jgi:uncharacterized protein (DUF433 family)